MDAADRDAIAEAVRRAELQTAGEIVVVIDRAASSYRTVPVDYHDGMQYPHLQRIEGTPDYLSRIIAARK